MDLFRRCSCIILSAGSSARMGEDKALLQFDSETNFLQKLTSTYLLAGLSEVVVVVHADLKKELDRKDFSLSPKVKIVLNKHPEKGRFYSLQQGLSQVSQTGSCFFQNIDNPLTTIETLNAIIHQSDEADVVIPTFETLSGHPVLVSQHVVNDIIKCSDTSTRIDNFLRNHIIKKVEVQDKSILVNINTKEDYNNLGFVSKLLT